MLFVFCLHVFAVLLRFLGARLTLSEQALSNDSAASKPELRQPAAHLADVQRCYQLSYLLDSLTAAPGLCGWAAIPCIPDAPTCIA